MRLKERMTSRHGKQKSRFSKNANMKDSGTREAVEEQLRLKDQLQKKIMTMNSSDEEDQQTEEKTLEQDENFLKDLPTTGIFGMKFMRKSMEKDKVDVDSVNGITIDQMSHAHVLLSSKKSSHNKEQKRDDEVDDDVDLIESTGQISAVGLSGEHRIKGRLDLKIQREKDLSKNAVFEMEEFPDDKSISAVYSANKIEPQHQQDQINDSDLKMNSKKSKKRKEIHNEISKRQKKDQTTEENEENDPKLKIHVQQNWKETTPVDQDEFHEENFIQLKSDSMKNDNQIVHSGRIVSDDKNPWMSKETTKKSKKGTKKIIDVGEAKQQKKEKHKLQKEEEDIEVDIENVISISSQKGGEFNVFSSLDKEQMEMVQRAFGTGDEDKEFEEMKEAAIQDGKPKQQSEPELPGWGSWAGEGIQKQQKSKNKIEEKPADIPKKQDNQQKHVIINEKKDKKAAKFTVGQVPYPFKKKDQYEKSLITPVGKDWNSSQMFNKLIRPSVSVKAGTIIEPLTLSVAKDKLIDTSQGYQKHVQTKKKKPTSKI